MVLSSSINLLTLYNKSIFVFSILSSINLLTVHDNLKLVRLSPKVIVIIAKTI